MKINEVLKYARTLNQHTQLYDILKHRLINKGYIRSDKQKEDLNDLVLSELHLIANNSYQGFEAQSYICYSKPLIILTPAIINRLSDITKSLSTYLTTTNI